MRAVDEYQQEDDGEANFLHSLWNLQVRCADMDALLKSAKKASDRRDRQRADNRTGKAAETPDDKQRSSVLQQAEKLYWADVPYLWGYTQTDTIAIRNEVSGVVPLSTGWVLFQTATIAG